MPGGIPGGTLAFFLAAFLILLGLHASLLHFPYFWDEAGYYIPAARDILLGGDLIPHETRSNAHPPLVMVWLALAWKLFGFTPLVTRTAMLLVAAFALAGVYGLGRRVANLQVALATAVCVGLFPVFFAQSTLAHLDMAAAAFTLWGLLFYLEQRRAGAVAWFALAALAKETAVITPVALALWELWCSRRDRQQGRQEPAWEQQGRLGKMLDACAQPGRSWKQSMGLPASLLPLAGWFGYHYARTGYVFGNPEFVDYNLLANLHPVRFLVAGGVRLWQLAGYMNLFVLTVATVLAMRLPPLSEPERARWKAAGNGERRLQRPRIELRTQAVFGVVIAGHWIALSVLGGAVLARYLLPVYPLVILLCVSTLWRRVPWWPAYLLLVCLGFGIALLAPPPYRTAPEDHLGYARFVRMHQAAAAVLERMAQERNGGSGAEGGFRVLTAWPASDELTRPYLSYVSRAIPVVRVENFSPEQLQEVRSAGREYDAAFLFSTKQEPSYRFPLRWRLWEAIQERFLDYHRDVLPEQAATLLGGQVSYREQAAGQWVAILVPDQARGREVHLPGAEQR
jgi:4-amino-4-deoxy-L-arabinose transferase-like glycosyltransferase